MMQAEGWGGGASVVVVVVVFSEWMCVCCYWYDDITLCVWGRLWAKSGPAGLAARQINCWTLREGGGHGRWWGGGV